MREDETPTVEPEPEPDKLARAIENVLASVLGVTPMHWVLVVADAEGDVHGLCSPGMPLWQRQGLLAWDAQSYGPQPMWTDTTDF